MLYEWYSHSLKMLYIFLNILYVYGGVSVHQWRRNGEGLQSIIAHPEN